MATVFPGNLDTYAVLIDNVDNILASHQNDRADAIKALQAKVGRDNSAVTSSHDYKLRNLPQQGSTAVVTNLNADKLDGADRSTLTTLGTSDVLIPTQNAVKTYVDGKTITAGNGLTGGGDLSANRTVTMGTPSTNTVASANSTTASSHTHALDLSGRSVIAGSGLTGGGTLAANRTLSINVGVTAGNGLTGGGTLTATRTVTLGTPGTITEATSNSVSASSHTHALGQIYPVGSFYVQYPNANSNTESTAFPTTRRPAALFGGTWAEQWRDEATFFSTVGTNTRSTSGRTNGLQDDQMQGHRHLNGYNDNTGAVGSNKDLVIMASADSTPGLDGTVVRNPSTDGTNGTPRTGAETRVRNRGIKVYKRTA